MTPHICQRCNGPCRAWAGDFHGWTCRECLRRYVDEQQDAPRKVRKRTGEL